MRMGSSFTRQLLAGSFAFAAALIATAPLRAQSAPPSPAAAAETVTDTTAPVLLHRERLVHDLSRAYPAELRKTATEGAVVLRMTVEPDGRVRRGSLRVVSSTHPDFVQPARRVAMGLRFQPATADGKHVAAQVTLPMSFRVF